jgi:hypothetical protein
MKWFISTKQRERKKEKVQPRENVEFVQYINKENKHVLCVRLVAWQFAKLKVSSNTT